MTRYFASLNMTTHPPAPLRKGGGIIPQWQNRRCDFSRTHYDLMCAIEIAPPNKITESQKIPSVIASERRERGNQPSLNARHGGLLRFARESSFVMLSEAKHLMTLATRDSSPAKQVQNDNIKQTSLIATLALAMTTRIFYCSKIACCCAYKPAILPECV